jgi:hypothetical protein
MVVVAMLTGMAHLRGSSPARHHVPSRHWSSPERAELGDTSIPVRPVRGSYDVGSRTRSTNPRVYRETRQSSPTTTDATPEVIVGYVDPKRGPAAFHRLTRVSEGDRVKVVRRDNSVAWFKVDSVRHMVRREIARERSQTGRPELRLVSLRGSPHHRAGNRPADVVVSAHLDRPSQTPLSPNGDDQPVER